MNNKLIKENLKQIVKKAKTINEGIDKLSNATAEYLNDNFPNVFQRFGSEFVMNAIRKEVSSSQSTNPEVLANAVFKTMSAGVQEAKQTKTDMLPAEKPRNFVAKNALGGGAGAHKDKKREAKKGNFKHKNKAEMYESSLLSEIGYADELGDLNMSDADIIEQSTKDGTIGQKSVMKFVKSNTVLYFFNEGEKISALVLLEGKNLKAIKNFTSEKGMVFALMNYIVNIKNMNLIIDSSDSLTKYGIDWVIKLNDANSGIKVTDLNGGKIDSSELRAEWEESKSTQGQESGPTSIKLSEASAEWKRKLQLNERSLMPYKFFKTDAKIVTAIDENINQEAHLLAIEKLRRALKNPNVPPAVRRKIEDHLKYELEQKTSAVAEGLGSAIFGDETVAQYQKAMGWLKGGAEGAMTTDDIMARNKYKKEFVSKVAGALSSAIKAGAVVKSQATKATAPEEENPNINRGYNESFAKFEKMNAIFESIVNEAAVPTIAEYLKSVVLYYARQQGVTGLGTFEQTVDKITQEIDAQYPNRGFTKKLEDLADVTFSLSQSEMQHQNSGFNPEMGAKGDQVVRLVQSMSTADDADDLEAIARQALIKLAKLNPQEYATLMQELRRLGTGRLR
jgi:hypothetical protein